MKQSWKMAFIAAVTILSGCEVLQAMFPPDISDATWLPNRGTLGDSTVSISIAEYFGIEARLNDDEWANVEEGEECSILEFPVAQFENGMNTIEFRTKGWFGPGPATEKQIWKSFMNMNYEGFLGLNIDISLDGVVAPDAIVEFIPMDGTTILPSMLAIPDQNGRIAITGIKDTKGFLIESETYETYWFPMGEWMWDHPDPLIADVDLRRIVPETKIVGTLKKSVDDVISPFNKTDGNVLVQPYYRTTDNEYIGTDAFQTWIEDCEYNSTTGEYELDRLNGGYYFLRVIWNSMFYDVEHIVNAAPGAATSYDIVIFP